MSKVAEPSIRVHIDPTNPGQFFACCGLLELAHRLWSGAEGWFEEQGLHFLVRPTLVISDFGAAGLINKFARCSLTNTMTETQLKRRDELASMPKKSREKDSALEAEKKALDTLWREAPILLHEPFHIRLDWFIDERAGGDAFKTWAGQQSVVEIARGMKAPLLAEDWSTIAPEHWLEKSTNSDCLPFNFDSDLGGMGSDRDVGFSFDPLGIQVRTRPLVELLAFIGLQRFRPARVVTENRYRFSLWSDPLVPEVAAPAACCLLKSPGSRTFEFRLLYRTKYLKSFLPANPIGGNR
ncbi:MAG: type I-U CRISPR-associated protein Cas8c [Deltaproteobacteria bacterium]|nr:type I-U CRISPR-associated protein Cas8c [Deltaproteobacteria bacterium]